MKSAQRDTINTNQQNRTTAQIQDQRKKKEEMDKYKRKNRRK